MATTAILLSVAASLALAQNTGAPARYGNAPSQPAPPAPLPPKPPLDPGKAIPESDVQFKRDVSIGIWPSEADLHEYYVNQYLQSGTIYIPVGGNQYQTAHPLFVEPLMRLVLAHNLKFNGANITAIDAYRLDKVELIGIAKHDPPVAFIINRHSAFSPLARGFNARSPQQEDAPATPTDIRPLTDFEKTALVEIKAGKDVVDQPGPDGSCVIVGAIRAQEVCLQCHTGYKTGEALGALSYHLTKVDLFDGTTNSPAPAR